MPRPKKNPDASVTEKSPTALALDALRAAEKSFETSPSLFNWSKVETASNEYRKLWLADLDAAPLTKNGEASE